jgi:hypothetical protein
VVNTWFGFFWRESSPATRFGASGILSAISLYFGTPEKENCASLSAAKDQGGQAARKLGHAVTGDLAASSRQMFLRTTQEEPGHCQE